MNPECTREAEVIRSAATGSWDSELRDHVASCASCAEAFELASLLHAHDEQALVAARVPAAGLTWWRATIRARSEAARKAEQPITFVHGVAGSCAVAIGCSLVAYLWRSMPWPALEVTASEHAVPLMLAVALCLLVAPLAVYVALARD
ncbi:MAG TPA: hypothetical protein VEU08_11855 [Vicinamibacterales bacterium]|nr:hypothetical protein [Vicinamibacterales bacterium]